jgi:hypothetical protein
MPGQRMIVLASPNGPPNNQWPQYTRMNGAANNDAMIQLAEGTGGIFPQ